MSKIRKDPELMKKLKDMEDKKRSAALVEASISNPDPEGLSFEQWWMITNNVKPMRAHMKEILQAEFKSRGLKSHASKEQFDEALKRFGL